MGKVPNRALELRKLLMGASLERIRELIPVFNECLKQKQKDVVRGMKQNIKPGTTVTFEARTPTRGVTKTVQAKVERVMKSRIKCRQLASDGEVIGPVWTVPIRALKGIA